MAGRESVVLVLDCGHSMSRTLGTSTRLSTAKAGVRLYLQQKMMLSPKDEVALVVFGTPETDNDLNTERGGYEEIVTIKELGAPNIDFALSLNQLEPAEDREAQSDVLGALTVACDILEKQRGKNKMRTIFVFTDAATVPSECEDVVPISEHLSASGVCLRVVEVGSAECLRDSPAPPGRGVLSGLCDKCDEGIYCTSSSLMDQLASFKSRRVGQTSKCRVDLCISSELRVPVYCFLKTKVETYPAFRSLSAIAGVEAGVRARLDRNYFRVADVEGEEAVPAADRARAFAYGKQLVPVSAADFVALKYASGERSLEVLCSVPASDAQRHLVLSGTESVAAEPKNESAARALSALVLAAHEERHALVARYVWRKNANPKIALLSPDVENLSFFLNFLPFFEDFRTLRFPPLPHPNADQLEAAEKLIDAMSLITESGDELVRPPEWHNPSLQRFYQLVMAKALGGDEEQQAVSEVGAQLASLLEVPPAVRVRAEGPLKHLKDLCPLEPAADKKKRQRLFWRDNLKEKEAILREAKPEDLEKISFEEEDLTSGAPDPKRAARLNTMSVGTLRPVADFEAMIAVKELDLTEKAMTEMIEVVNRLLEESAKNEHFRKALECVVALRKACVGDHEPDTFNSFLRAARQMCDRVGRYQEFWDMIRTAQITLISTAEAQRSTITPEMASSFFESEGGPVEEDEAEGTPQKLNEAELLDLLE